MTERGPRSVDSAPACPFVAFEDDREARATSPDHRHRCYAELVPSPRAAAHQEAYCLSSAFPVCPTFQDWARREAAHARGEGDRPRAAPQARPEQDDEAGPTAPGAAALDDDRADDENERDDRPSRRQITLDEPPIRRNPPRDWAAPPPWATGAPGAGQTASRRPAGEDPTPPTFLAGRTDESRGLAGSAADRLVDRSSSAGSEPSGGVGSLDERDEELAGLVTGRRPVDRPEAEHLPPSRGGRRPTVSSTRNHQRERERERDAIVGPSWERARRYEAYPTIRSRTGLPALPRLAVMAGALVIAAVALFFLPALLGVGGDNDDGATTPQPSTSQGAPSASAAPTEPPEPSAQVYLIKEGDTLSTVASSFGLTLDELLTANPDFRENPDQVQIGDEIIIPATPPSEFTDPSAEPSTEAS
jgi:hypothetical protein